MDKNTHTIHALNAGTIHVIITSHILLSFSFSTFYRANQQSPYPTSLFSFSPRSLPFVSMLKILFSYKKVMNWTSAKMTKLKYSYKSLKKIVLMRFLIFYMRFKFNIFNIIKFRQYLQKYDI